MARPAVVSVRVLMIVALVVLFASFFGPTAGSAVASVGMSSGVFATGANGTHGTAPTPDSGARIVSVYPDPLAAEDAGEYVVIEFSDATNLSEWRLTDGESNASLPNRTVSGRVALTAAPNATATLTNQSVLGLDSFPSLANTGDQVRLIHGTTVVDELAYEDAPEAERGRRTPAGWKWTPLGATSFPVMNAGRAGVETFVLPDDPNVPLDVIRSADRRVLLAGYTFASERIATALKHAAARGVSVRVLVDDAPVGGITTREYRVLDSLEQNGVSVEVIGGERARYDFHHPKYAVVDDRALVMTENWKPAGTGGKSSRGWGAVVRNSHTANELAKLFHADADWRDTTAWSAFRAGRTGVDEAPSHGSYPTRFDSRNLTAENVRILAAPDNDEPAVVGLLDNATQSVHIIQAGIGSRHQPFLRAAIRAAERGVDVKILLSSAWYSEKDNRAIATWVNRRAQRGNLSLSAKVAQPNGRFEKIHAKGVIVDGDQALVGSLNWNNNSARENREVAVVLSGSAVAGYYGKVFDADWTGGSGAGNGLGKWMSDQPLPVGVVVAVAGIVVLVLLVARKIRFLE